jgi:hypothetical protein
VEFRLTYEGLLLASNTGQRDQKPARKEYKRKVRKVFHGQLRRPWEITPFLKRGTSGGPLLLSAEGGARPPTTTIEGLAAKHALYGFQFRPAGDE